MNIKKSKQKSLTSLWNKAGALLQQIHRTSDISCIVCGAKSTVLHHHFHWSRSNELRLHEYNLCPLCFKCHWNVHNGNTTTKIQYERAMREKYGEKWEDELLLQDQSHRKRTEKETILYLQEWIDHAKQELEART